MNPYEKFAKEICCNCIGQCDKGIVVSSYDNTLQVKCVDYVKKDNLQGYKKPKERTANQLKPLMKFTQEY